MERVIQLPSSLLSLPSLSPAQSAQTHPVARAFHVLPGGWSGFLPEQPRWASSALPDTGGSESTAAAVPCSAPQSSAACLHPLAAAKGTAGGTGIWAGFQAIAPLDTCWFFFFTDCLARLWKRRQENTTRQGQAQGKRQTQQGQARTTGHAGTDPTGTDPELCVCSLVWIHKQPPHSSAPQRASCLPAGAA